VTRKAILTIAEFSIHPIGTGTSVGRYVKAAIKAIAEIPGLKYQVTPMATVLESEDISTILQAVEVSHQTLRSMGVKTNLVNPQSRRAARQGSNDARQDPKREDLER
jgi:uncharacterized protein (TIGR00106 family)